MDIVLTHGEIISVDGDARGLVVSCLQGRLWVTQPGDPLDHLLAPGDRFIVTRRGRIAVMALEDARLQFPTAPEMGRGSHAWQVQAA